MARDLLAGQHFNITRLTVIENLAGEPKLVNRFVLHLAEKAEQACRNPIVPRR